MAVRHKTPSGHGNNYMRFAWGTIAAALLVSLASLDGDLGNPAQSVQTAAPQVAAAKPSAMIKPSQSAFAFDPPQSAESSAEGDGAADTPDSGADAPAQARAEQTGPPPGDPALQAGVKHYQAPAAAGPTPEMAQRLIAESRERSGSIAQGD